MTLTQIELTYLVRFGSVYRFKPIFEQAYFRISDGGKVGERVLKRRSSDKIQSMLKKLSKMHLVGAV